MHIRTIPRSIESSPPRRDGISVCECSTRATTTAAAACLDRGAVWSFQGRANSVVTYPPNSPVVPNNDVLVVRCW